MANIWTSLSVFVFRAMGRSRNDDRSDTMNPNNAAYWADQENRFGGGYEDEATQAESAAAKKPLLRHPLDAVADRDLGPPDRYQGLDLTGLRWALEDAFATPATMERDQQAAVAELLKMAEVILRIALEAAERQGVGGQVLVSERQVELLLHDGRSARAEGVLERSGFVRIIGADTQIFAYKSRTWQRAHLRKNQRNEDVYELDSPIGEQPAPLSALVRVLKAPRLAPGVADLRALVAKCEKEPVRSAFEMRQLAAKVVEIQKELSFILSKLPEHARTESWEDSWQPATGVKTLA